MTTTTTVMDREHRARMLAHTQEVQALTGYHRPNGTVLAVIVQHRDSGVLEQSNFATAVQLLTDIDPRCHVVSFGHWGVGWIEEISVPLTAAIVAEHADIVRRLADYPVLDDNDHSEREYADLLETLVLCYEYVTEENVGAVASWLFDHHGIYSSEELTMSKVSEATEALGFNVDEDDD